MAQICIKFCLLILQMLTNFYIIIVTFTKKYLSLFVKGKNLCKRSILVDDQGIIELYFDRNQQAIEETMSKYGGAIFSLSFNMLKNRSDAEECELDTYQNLWLAIPPTRPYYFKGFILKTTRNLALNRINKGLTKKRNAKIVAVEKEFLEALPQNLPPLEDQLALKEIFDGFLKGLDKVTRILFVQRYWYALTVKEIAKNLDLSVANVKTKLSRTRAKLKEYLLKEGITL